MEASMQTCSRDLQVWGTPPSCGAQTTIDCPEGTLATDGPGSREQVPGLRTAISRRTRSHSRPSPFAASL